MTKVTYRVTLQDVTSESMDIVITLPEVSRVRSLLILLQAEPAVVFLGVNAAVSIATAWGLKMTPQETATLLTATTAFLSLLIAILARPVSIPIIKGAVIALLTALEGFHLHLNQPRIAATVAGLSLVLGLLFRQNLTPTVHTRGLRERSKNDSPPPPPPVPAPGGTVG